MADFKKPPEAGSSGGSDGLIPEITFDLSAFLFEQTGYYISNFNLLLIALGLSVVTLFIGFRPRKMRRKEFEKYASEEDPDH